MSKTLCGAAVADIDDSDGRARRNLVVFSSLVILAAWLGIPPAAVADRAIGPGGARLDEWRVWTAVLAVLVYLLLRFRFAGEVRVAVGDALDEWRNRLYSDVKRSLSWRVALCWRYNFHSGAFGGRLRNLIDTLHRPIPGDQARATAVYRASITNVEFEQWPNARPNPFQGTVFFTTVRYLDGAWVGKTTGGRGLPYELKGPRRIALLFWTTLGWLLYSKAALEIVAPVALWLVATSAGIYHLVTA